MNAGRTFTARSFRRFLREAENRSELRNNGDTGPNGRELRLFLSENLWLFEAKSASMRTNAHVSHARK